VLRLHDDAPDFTLDGVQQGRSRRVSLSEYRRRWVVLFFYPADWRPGEATGGPELRY
jgi:peroxiredoxin